MNTTQQGAIFTVDHVGSTAFRQHIFVKYYVEHRRSSSTFNTGGVRGELEIMVGELTPNEVSPVEDIRVYQLHDKRTNDRHLYSAPSFDSDITLVFKMIYVNNLAQLYVDVINGDTTGAANRVVTCTFNIETSARGAFIVTLDDHNAPLLAGGTTVTASNFVILTTNGNVGIRTTDPTIFLAMSENDTGIHHPATDNIAIHTGGTERMIVDENGDVGIGTSTPSHKLDIEGTLHALSEVDFDAGLDIGATTRMNVVTIGRGGILQIEANNAQNIGEELQIINVISGNSPGGTRDNLFQLNDHIEAGSLGNHTGIIRLGNKFTNETTPDRVVISASSEVETIFNSGSNVGIGC